MRKHPLFWLPNLLTLLRCGLGIVVAVLIVMIAGNEAGLADIIHSASVDPGTRDMHRDMIADYRSFWGGIASIVFVAAAVTDFLDGFLARKWKVESRFGRLIDPIADKFLLGFPLLAIAAVAGWPLPLALPVFLILFRDVAITLLRFIGLGSGRMAVRGIAKIKTFLEIVVVGLFLAIMTLVSSSDPNLGNYQTLWIIALWGTAILSVYTGLIYLVGLFHAPERSIDAAEPMDENN